jgi:putative ABC transport system permease protein
VYAVLEGRDLTTDLAGAGAADGSVPIIVNQNVARLDGIGIGDRFTVSRAPGRTLQAFAATATCRVVGIANFYFDLPAQRSLALANPVLRRLQGRTGADASLILVRMTTPARADALARWITARDPRVDAFSIQQFLDRAGARLTYFNQFSLILGTISVAVSFLLVTTIVTLSVGERLGEIAMLRALGFTRGRIVQLVVAEGVALSLVSLPAALALGVVIGGYLDRILRAAPAVPEGLHFFTLTAAAVVRTAALLIATGAIGGAYPAAVAARLGIAATLHREIVS